MSGDDEARRSGGDTGGGTEDDEYAELIRQRTFDPETVREVEEQMRREARERRERLFGDREPFAIPETDEDL
ncbi:hypothetical protein [Nocardia bovistercoris]|uniref:Uncharacterized protein n=1 Tax=Nocardia bovistercoris TaxID=2785916 RepID=A0A931ID15_9NOCA|nr:hypothetical protein [Nocardia bovistercoris]MBH0777595.1 hypothetical protein [Nocardia bovistercoris]